MQSTRKPILWNLLDLDSDRAAFQKLKQLDQIAFETGSLAELHTCIVAKTLQIFTCIYTDRTYTMIFSKTVIYSISKTKTKNYILYVYINYTSILRRLSKCVKLHTLEQNFWYTQRKPGKEKKTSKHFINCCCEGYKTTHITLMVSDPKVFEIYP